MRLLLLFNTLHAIVIHLIVILHIWFQLYIHLLHYYTLIYYTDNNETTKKKRIRQSKYDKFFFHPGVHPDSQAYSSAIKQLADVVGLALDELLMASTVCQDNLTDYHCRLCMMPVRNTPGSTTNL
jgi:hypothetical protein